ncbi:MAG: phage tail protein [Sedimentisphaerales bacterium]|nr:phage tail protein [Sedimentisphaerales bacterium]
MRRKYSWPLLAVCGIVLVSLALTDSGELWGQKADGQALVLAGSDSYIFRLQLQQGIEQDYTECAGLGSSNAIEEATRIASSGVLFTEKTPGTLEWDNITLRRAGPSSPGVWQWRMAMENLNLDMAIQNGTITVLTIGSPEPVAQWSFRAGWAARLTFNGSREELVIVHDGLQRIGTEGGPPPSRR